MIPVDIAPATPADVEHVALNLRAADRDECEALGHYGPDSVRIAVKHAFETDAGRIDGETICLFGLGLPLIFGHIARPWMLGTDGIEDHPIIFLKHSRGVISRWFERYPVLENWIDARNHVSIAWLKWLSFTIDEAAPYGPKGLPFHRFSMRR